MIAFRLHSDIYILVFEMLKLVWQQYGKQTQWMSMLYLQFLPVTNCKRFQWCKCFLQGQIGKNIIQGFPSSISTLSTSLIYISQAHLFYYCLSSKYNNKHLANTIRWVGGKICFTSYLSISTFWNTTNPHILILLDPDDSQVYNPPTQTFKLLMIPPIHLKENFHLPYHT